MEPLLIIGALGALLLAKKDGTISEVNASRPLESLPDVDPAFQSGKYNRTHDAVYKYYSERHGVPFALIKAHAIRESLQDPRTIRVEPSTKASYGLMQILWWPNSSRFKNYGYSDDAIGIGEILYDPWVNVDIACHIIKANFKTWPNLRDAVNAYNTGRDEKTRPAPGNYVNDVIKTYETILGRKI